LRSSRDFAMLIVKLLCFALLQFIYFSYFRYRYGE